MSTPATTPNSPDLGQYTLAAEMTFFIDQLNWPVSLDTRHQRLVARTGCVLDAIRMREHLAEPTAHELAVSLMSGPVCRDETGWWTFITAPRRGRPITLPDDLLHSRAVYALPRGREVVVPPVAATTRWWCQPQPGRSLPPWSAVVAVARSALSRRG
ncbi:hypothetical protein [Saccharopolyspora shandongensis]|nr:hypothetical protein [Saccharopolyspora shandongensis]